MLKIRLSLKGNKKNHIFPIIVIDKKKSRNSKPKCILGFIDKKNNRINLNKTKYFFYIKQGAIVNKKLKSFLTFYLLTKDKNNTKNLLKHKKNLI